MNTDMSSSQEPSQNEGSAFKAIFLDTTILLCLVSAFLYTAGWSFTYHYFNYFHVGLSVLDLSKENYFIYGLWVAQDHVFLLFLVILSCYAVSLLPRFHTKFFARIKLAISILFFLVPLIVLLMFGASYKLGVRTAKSRFFQQKYNDYPYYPRVGVSMIPQSYSNMTEDEKKKALEKEKSLKKGCYRLLLQNKDKLFLFYSLKEFPDMDLSVVIIPQSQVRSSDILPHYNSCGT